LLDDPLILPEPSGINDAGSLGIEYDFPSAMNTTKTPDKDDFLLKISGVPESISSVRWTTATRFIIKSGTAYGGFSGSIEYIKGAIPLEVVESGREYPSFGPTDWSS